MLARQRLKDGREVTIREAAEDDAAGLLENINAIGAEEVFLLVEDVGHDVESEKRWVRTFDGKASVLYVAESGGKIVGQVDAHLGSYAKSRHTATLGIAVREGWRGVGLGRGLMDVILAWMRERGVEKACLEVFASNERAVMLYRHLGFEEEGRRRAHYRIRGELVDGIFMARWLGEAPPRAPATPPSGLGP